MFLQKDNLLKTIMDSDYSNVLVLKYVRYMCGVWAVLDQTCIVTLHCKSKK